MPGQGFAAQGWVQQCQPCVEPLLLTAAPQAGYLWLLLLLGLESLHPLGVGVGDGCHPFPGLRNREQGYVPYLTCAVATSRRGGTHPWAHNCQPLVSPVCLALEASSQSVSVHRSGMLCWAAVCRRGAQGGKTESERGEGGGREQGEHGQGEVRCQTRLD